MDVLPELPVVVLLASALAAVLIMIEAALPTFGIAGTAALAFATIAVLSTGDGDHPWWPLLFVVLAVVVWAVQLTFRREHRGLRIFAAASYAVGSLGYAIAAEDLVTAAVAIVTSVALPLVFPRLASATRRILDQPVQSGMEALVGQRGEVAEAPEGLHGPGRLTVRVDGSLWNAHSPAPLSPGTQIVVTGFSGMTLDVAVAGPHPYAPAAPPTR